MDSSQIATSSPFSAKAWGVAWTKSKCEKALAEYLAERSIPHFLPLISKRRVYGRHVRQSSLPLFPGYVFFDTVAIDRCSIFASKRVADVLEPADEPQLRADLLNLAIALKSDCALRETRFGEPGRIVTIKTGTMKGLSGELMRMGPRNCIVIRCHFLGKAAELEIDEAFIDY
jgi:hypothetical protein